MLQSIRDRLSGPIIWFVVGLICIPFAFWGIESFRTGSADAAVVEVGDHKISDAEFRQGYDQRYQQLQALLGDNFRPEMIDTVRFRKNVLDDMVQEQVLRQYAHSAGYRATDASLFSYLNSIPAFQENGRFSAQKYKDALSSRGMQPQQFESQMRESLVIDQLRSSVVESAFVTDQEAAMIRRLEGQSRDIGVAVFSVAKLKEQVAVDDAQVKARYESDKARYMAPERLKLAYLDLNISDLPKAENPGPQVLKAAYEAEKDSRFTGSEERRARHILVNFGADKAASKAKIEKFAAEIKAGASLADLAKQNSDDTGSKPQGGDLGWIKRGTMVQSFEEALFDLDAGEVSDPVQTEFGWHLIQVEQIKPPTVRPFDSGEVQAELLEVYQQREAEKRFQELSEKLEQLAFENPASLDPVAQALQLPVKNTDWFTRTSGEGLVAEEAVKTAAFSPEVLTDGENSKPLSVGVGHVVVIRKAEYEPPHQRPLDEVIAQIREDVKTQLAQAQASSKASALITALRAGEGFEAAVAAQGAELGHNAAVKRRDATPERAIVDAAFKLARPVEPARGLGQVALANGDVAVILLRSVQEPGPDAASDPVERGQLREAVAGAEFAALRKVLQSELKVKFFEPPPPEAAPPATPEGEPNGS